MNLNTILIIISVVLIIAIGVFAFLAFFDWRAWMIRKVGANYKRGLAHVKENDVWVYRESTLIYESHDAMSYNRETTIDGKKQFVTDIVPNKIGFTPDEYTGARVYRVAPGGTVAFSDDGDAPAVDYPARLISAHVLGRTAEQFASSVTAESGMNWKPIIIIGVAAIIIVAVVFFVIKPGTPATTPATNPTTTPNVPTGNVTQNLPPNEIIPDGYYVEDGGDNGE